MLENFDDFDTFMAEVENFLRTHDMAPRRFGQLALNKPCFVLYMRRGSESYPRTMRKVREWMMNYEPPPPKPKKHKPPGQYNKSRVKAAVAVMGRRAAE